MKAKTKRAIRQAVRVLRLTARRLALRCARKLLDLADDRLHAAEVAFREEMSLLNDFPARHQVTAPAASGAVKPRQSEDMPYQEPGRAGIDFRSSTNHGAV